MKIMVDEIHACYKNLGTFTPDQCVFFGGEISSFFDKEIDNILEFVSLV
jgi:hypothetical protein